MATIKVTNEQLARVVTDMLTNPDNKSLPGYEDMCKFMTDIAKNVAYFAGGQILQGVSAESNPKSTGFSNGYTIVIDDSQNDRYPINNEAWFIPESKEVTIQSISSEIVEIHYEKGDFKGEYYITEGKSTGCGYSREAIAKKFPSLDEAIVWLSHNYSVPTDKSQFDFENIDNGVIYAQRKVSDHTHAQNGGWFEASESDIQSWKNGKQKMYQETFTISLLN